MAGITLDLQLSGLKSLDPMLEFTNPKLFAKALKGGISYAAKAGITASSKAVTARYNIKAARVKQDIKGPFIRNDTATLIFSRRPPTINQYGISLGARGGKQPGLGRGMGWGKPSPKGKPITARIFKDGQRQAYNGAFMIEGRNGQAIPVRRVKGKLKAIYGPSIGSDIFGKGRYAVVIQAEVTARMNEQFITGMQRVLDSAARGFTKS